MWPTVPRDSYVNPSHIFLRYQSRLIELRNDTTIPDVDLLEQVRRMWTDQETRLSSIDSRAGQLMAAAGIAASLTTSAVNQKGVFPVITGKTPLIAAYLLALGYFAYCIIIALRVHGERRRHKVGPDELVPPAVVTSSTAPVAYARHLAHELLTSLIKNYQSDNRQAETLYVAQRAFRNAVILLVFGGASAIWS
jgi:hypothetical protein